MLGRRIEVATNATFNVIRWSAVVGFARFLVVEAPSVWIDVFHWAARIVLFGRLAARFLLRPDVRLFPNLDRPWKRRVQTALNYALCLLAFILVMAVLNHLIDGFARYPIAPKTD